ncbi:MAG: iron-sulfur cluster assembly accessory protein [Myxococcales bacterium]|nr:iron-sulfur cluster assembly accessory protein [Myxococcales bacterium]USN50028.1 MAG: iron-sulfur cluster assembly accessory protein [Myxococcales bacterium]
MDLLKIKRRGERKAKVEDPYALAILPLEPNVLGISDQAAARIEFLLQEKKQTEHYLRVAIKGGGCSGLSIHYQFCEKSRDSDVIFQKNNAKVCIDPKSLSVLGGATLHFREYLGSGEFLLLNNPAAKQCSCGQSFSL